MKIQLDQLASPFHLGHILGCGQVFRWEILDGWWYGVVREQVVKISRVDEELEFYIFPPKNDRELVESYFRLNDDLPLILSKIDKDQYIRKAIHHSYGLRITRQDPWECLISYICATYKNIPAIKDMILNLAKKFGKKMKVDDHVFYTFPEPHHLAEANLEELKKCKLGYRAEHVLETSRIIHNRDFNLNALKTVDYEEAKRELIRLPGVGQKVADCVLLFSLDRLDAFPVDIWIKRIVAESYSDHFEKSLINRISKKSSLTPREYEEISFFGREYFGQYAGYAQQYLFHHKRFGQSYGRSSNLTKGNSEFVSSFMRKPLFK